MQQTLKRIFFKQQYKLTNLSFILVPNNVGTPAAVAGVAPKLKDGAVEAVDGAFEPNEKPVAEVLVGFPNKPDGGALATGAPNNPVVGLFCSRVLVSPPAEGFI